MRIVQLTPGTGNFYCGNCLRDNALVNALRGMGHDVLMVPMYLPHIVDEEAAADAPIFFGGVNVYLQQKLSLFRHTPGWIDRLFNGARLLRFAANRSGMTGAKDLGELTISMLEGEQGKQHKELTKLIEWLRQRGPIDVVVLSNALLIGLARRIRRELGVPVVCTLSGEDGFLDGLIEPYRERAWATLAERAQEIDAFIAVSRYYGDVMRERLSLDAERVHVVYNGINVDGYAPADPPPNPPAVGFLARMCPPKGLHTLIDAFVILKRRDRVPGLKLRVAGSVTPEDKRYVAEQKRRLAEAGLEGDAEFMPDIDHAEKERFLRSLSVLSVPATSGEAFGLYLLEAWASGVPVVQPRCAAFPELIETTGGGVLCEPGDPEALADALEVLLLREEEARRMGLAGREAVTRRFTVETMANDVLRVYERAVGLSTANAPDSAPAAPPEFQSKIENRKSKIPH